MSTIYEKDISTDLKKFINYTKENAYYWAEFNIVTKDDDMPDVWIDTWDWTGADLNLAKQDLIALGTADGMGGYFALWDEGKNKPLEEMPVVILGSEGEFPLVAQNLKDLMRLMTTGEELSLNENTAWCSPDSIGNYNENYAQWIKKEFGLDPIQTEEEANQIIQTANKIYGESFEAWAQKALDPNFTIEYQ